MCIKEPDPTQVQRQQKVYETLTGAGVMLGTQNALVAKPKIAQHNTTKQVRGTLWHHMGSIITSRDLIELVFCSASSGVVVGTHERGGAQTDCLK